MQWWLEYYKHSNRFRAHLDVSQSLFYLAVAKPENASHNSVLTCPVMTTKQPLCSLKLPPADADARPLGTPGKYRQVYKHVCVRACVCLQGERKTHRGGRGGRRDEDLPGSAFFFFFTHSPHKGPSVLAASKSGRRPHDSLLPISRVTPQPQRRRRAGVPGLYGSAVN